MDDLRNYFRGSEQKKLKKESDVRESETEIEKNLRMKDSMISSYTHQIEDLKIKVKRIPQLASQLSQLESLNARLKSSFKQKEEEICHRNAKLESALNAYKTKVMDMETQHNRNIAELKASKDALEQDHKRTNKRAVELEDKNSKLEQDMKFNEESHRALKEEKKMLEERILQLEKVRAEQRSTLGIVISVDLSGSLMGNSQLLAKDAFRTLINELRSNTSKVHVGVVVHGPSTYIAHHMAEVEFYTSSFLDLIDCGGSEDYVQAFTFVVYLLSEFKHRHRGAKRRVIMISDGEGYSTLTDLSTLCADGVPCHNIIVGNRSYSTSTAACSSITGGRDFTYNGSFSSGDIDDLIGP